MGQRQGDQIGQIFDYWTIEGNFYVHNVDIRWMGYISGNFFTNSSDHPEANTTTVSYNASVVKIYNSTSSLVRFRHKK
jgi:hypothetical protein